MKLWSSLPSGAQVMNMKKAVNLRRTKHWRELGCSGCNCQTNTNDRIEDGWILYVGLDYTLYKLQEQQTIKVLRSATIWTSAVIVVKCVDWLGFNGMSTQISKYVPYIWILIVVMTSLFTIKYKLIKQMDDDLLRRKTNWFWNI